MSIFKSFTKEIFYGSSVLKFICAMYVLYVPLMQNSAAADGELRELCLGVWVHRYLLVGSPGRLSCKLVFLFLSVS